MRTSEAPVHAAIAMMTTMRIGAIQIHMWPGPIFWRGLGTFITFPLGNDSRDQTRWTSRGLLPAFSSPPWGRSALRVPERASVASNHSQRMNQVRGRWPRRPVVSGQSWQAPAEAGDPMILAARDDRQRQSRRDPTCLLNGKSPAS